MVEIGKDYSVDFGGCCPRRVTIIAADEKMVHFQTRDLVKHQMPITEFVAISYRV